MWRAVMPRICLRSPVSVMVVVMVTTPPRFGFAAAAAPEVPAGGSTENGMIMYFFVRSLI